MFSKGVAMLHELRIYHSVPGKLPELNKRFESITLGMWKKHGIRQIGFWTVLVGVNSNSLYYLLEWDSLAERESKWNAFQNDPEWKTAKAGTEVNGPIVERIENMILVPTSYSALR